MRKRLFAFLKSCNPSIVVTYWKLASISVAIENLIYGLFAVWSSKLAILCFLHSDKIVNWCIPVDDNLFPAF